MANNIVEHIPSYAYAKKVMEEVTRNGEFVSGPFTVSELHILLIRAWEDGFSMGRNTKPAIEVIRP